MILNLKTKSPCESHPEVKEMTSSVTLTETLVASSM